MTVINELSTWERNQFLADEVQRDAEAELDRLREEVAASTTMMEHFTAMAEESILYDALENIIGNDQAFIELLQDAIEVQARAHDMRTAK